ncbi:hypothetical protein TNCV_1498961 [Trichonephila clavipes]|nr:hypothetical protein TNCV_1498961 [Trichonephila clavipes]
MAKKDVLEFVQSSKNIIDADSDDENEMNNVTPAPTSSEMRSIIKVIEHITGPPAPNSSKKYGPRIKDAENPHHTVTFGECSGTRNVKCGLSVSQIRQL